ncbi:MAG: hypothetical protein ACRD22_19985 [Terriglobia bacterium]
MTVSRNVPPKDVHLSYGDCQVDVTEEVARRFFHELGVLLQEEHANDQDETGAS